MSSITANVTTINPSGNSIFGTKENWKHNSGEAQEKHIFWGRAADGGCLDRYKPVCLKIYYKHH